MLKWTASDNDYYSYLKQYWRAKTSWTKALHDGVAFISDKTISATPFAGDVESISNKSSALELALYQSNSLGDGTQANNPWLQELPDPITRACWDNYITISASTARENGLSNWNNSDGSMDGNVVRLTIGDTIIENVPVLIQPGQANGTIGLALGYGRTSSGKVGDGVGVNAYPLITNNDLVASNVTIEKWKVSMVLHLFGCTIP